MYGYYPYFKTGLEYVHGSMIGQFNFSSFVCNTGYEIYKDLYDGYYYKCVCSANLKYYISDNKCVSCSNFPSTAITTVTGCQLCDSLQGFFKATVSCYYCPSISHSTGKALRDGCEC